eukprot:4547167-Pleurochrysis_carterae.AAC.1
MLLQKVKGDNAEIAEAEKKVAETQEALRKGRAHLASLKSGGDSADDPKAAKQQARAPTRTRREGACVARAR